MSVGRTFYLSMASSGDAPLVPQAIYRHDGLAAVQLDGEISTNCGDISHSALDGCHLGNQDRPILEAARLEAARQLQSTKGLLSNCFSGGSPPIMPAPPEEEMLPSKATPIVKPTPIVKAKVTRSCAACRLSKVRCVQREESSLDTPCQRCHRLGLKCFFEFSKRGQANAKRDVARLGPAVRTLRQTRRAPSPQTPQTTSQAPRSRAPAMPATLRRQVRSGQSALLAR